MPLEFIPNQPFVFETAYPLQPCLNNDNRAYGQLVTTGDKTPIQVKVLSCIGDELLCDPDMYEEGSQLFPFVSNTPPGSFTKGTGWTENATYLTYTGTGSAAGLASRLITTTQGQAMKLRITVDLITCPLRVNFGLTQTQTITTTGTHTMYFIAENDASATQTTLSFGTDGASNTGSDQIRIYGASVASGSLLAAQLFDIIEGCWSDDGAVQDGAASWTYVNDGDGINIQGKSKFCSNNTINRGDLINYAVVGLDGNWSCVNLTVSNCTQGGVEVYINDTLMGTTTGNGRFVFYGIPSGVNVDRMLIRKVGGFDGCVGDFDAFAFTIPALILLDADGDPIGTAINATMVEDRAIWDVEWTKEYFDIDLECGVYSLRVTDNCPDPATRYDSVNVAIFDPNGHPCTFVLDGKCDGQAFDLIFDDVDGDPVYSLRQRLRILSFNPTYPAKGEEYLTSAGTQIRSYAESGKVKEALFDRVDEITHDCIRLQLLCDETTLDAKAVFFPAQDYEPEWANNGKYNLAQSRADIIFVNETTRFNRSC